MIDEKQKKMIEEYAQTIATNLVLYGVYMRDKYDSAVEMSCALAEAYNRGMQDGMNRAFESQPKVGEWIPCSERLPKERDWYLAVFKERDTGFIGLPYIADYLMGKHTTYTTNDGWIIKDCTDRYDCESEYHKGLECVAWMPLPEPYKE